MQITIIDYDSGNIKSVAKAFEHVGASVVVSRDAKIIAKADKLVLPGVGHFAHCMKNLARFGLVDTIKTAIAQGKPFLGICLGLQLLFDSSEEAPGVSGLGILAGTVKKFDFTHDARRMTHDEKIPHMGWNQLVIKKRHALLDGVSDGDFVYFVHSYFVDAKDFSVVAATTEYSHEFCSAVIKENIFACQFHPEKSQAVGLKIIGNFAKI